MAACQLKMKKNFFDEEEEEEEEERNDAGQQVNANKIRKWREKEKT